MMETEKKTRGVCWVAVVVLMTLFWAVVINAVVVGCGEERSGGTVRDTVRNTVVDTVSYDKPVVRDSVVVRYVTKRLPAVRDTAHIDCTDSVEVDMPITQKRYEDSTYTAWVSGYEPNLDSIRVFSRKETVIVKERIRGEPRRFGIDVGVGYGITPNGVRPYTGVVLGYRIL